jgi:hypothetical protein
MPLQEVPDAVRACRDAGVLLLAIVINNCRQPSRGSRARKTSRCPRLRRSGRKPNEVPGPPLSRAYGELRSGPSPDHP